MRPRFGDVSPGCFARQSAFRSDKPLFVTTNLVFSRATSAALASGVVLSALFLAFRMFRRAVGQGWVVLVIFLSIAGGGS